ncbi:hypothetical protein [Allosalinactinospora lopnorensis]|uniref:hypothetical protein n=1 Tax=Allosalinactinospora lopnorensis TaxID=1352348 RepID=UPI000623E517|nr:hypothetical protein [Allosalinactinospora lopnorensis]
MDLKTRDIPGTTDFFSAVLGRRFAVDEDDWRRATFISVGGYRIGSVSDLANGSRLLMSMTWTMSPPASMPSVRNLSSTRGTRIAPTRG